MSKKKKKRTASTARRARARKHKTHIKKKKSVQRVRARSVRASAGEFVTLTFKKDAGSANLVRVTLDGTEEVLSPGSSNGSAQPRAVGSQLTALIEIAGNPGDRARVQVGHSTPEAMSIRIPAGRTRNTGTVPLLVEEES